MSMRYTVYLDLLFSVNLCMNVWILIVTGRILRRKLIFGRVLFGGMIGAVWICLTVLLVLPVWFEQLISLMPVAGLMQHLAFAPNLKKDAVRNIAALYGVSFLMGGFLSAVASRTGGLSFLIRFPLILLFGFIIILGAETFRARQGRALCQVKLVWKGISIEMAGLIDTGNSLRTGEGKRPVHVVSADAVTAWQSQSMDGILWVPYRSVGSQGGLLPAIVIDELWIDDRFFYEHPVVAFSKYPVSSNGNYQILIHPQEALQ